MTHPLFAVTPRGGGPVAFICAEDITNHYYHLRWHARIPDVRVSEWLLRVGSQWVLVKTQERAGEEPLDSERGRITLVGSVRKMDPAEAVAWLARRGKAIPPEFDAVLGSRRLSVVLEHDAMRPPPAKGPIPAGGGPRASRLGRDAKGGARHGPDYRSARWFGTTYTFTPNQAAVVRVLWEAWENGTPDVGQETLTGVIDSDARLRDVFRKGKRLHPAWNRMIVTTKKGAYRLQKPERGRQASRAAA